MLISRYLKTGNLNLYKEIQNLKIDLDVDSYFSTVFSKKVLNALLNIPVGSTCSYSKIGEIINSRAFRAIGSVLKKNHLPLIIPCHRVIRKDGTVGGFMGKADDSWQTNLKRSLLELEKEKNYELSEKKNI
ncbi:MAG: MGMT family protein [Promethearchaeota archaeon]|nr:MAG: MGMT family protein [Candidatus Lokiarchaeota archaeon]